jgi:hypothetical protein
VREAVRDEEGDDLVSLSFFELNFRNMFMLEGCVALGEASNVAMLKAAFETLQTMEVGSACSVSYPVNRGGGLTASCAML